MGFLNKLFGRFTMPEDKTEQKGKAQVYSNLTPEQEYDLAYSYETGEGAEKNLENAAAHYRIAAKAGHNEAQYRLGMLVCASPSEDDMQWIEAAAQRGHVPAMRCMGTHLLANSACDNRDDILKWLLPASELGDGESSELAGKTYMNNHFGEPDYQRAKEYFARAWEQGVKSAAAQIAICAYETEQYEDAFAWAEKAIEAEKNADAYYILGKLHEKSLCGEAEGILAALDYYDQASMLGNKDASFWLAGYYEGEHGGKADETMHGHYMTLAAQQGHPEAQYRMGSDALLHHTEPEAVKAGLLLLASSAQSGNGNAAYLLGTTFRDGFRVKTDYEKAMAYFNQANKQGLPMAELAIAKMYIDGQGVDNPMFGLVRVMALADDPNCFAPVRREALYIAGRAYCYGIDGAQQDVEGGLKWLTESAEMGYPEAMYELASCYGVGEIVERDYDVCRHWLMKGVEQQHDPSYYLLAVLEENGLGMDPDPEAALDHYSLSAEHGFADSLFRMFEIYHDGELGVEADLPKAKEYLIRAAKADSADAMCRMGRQFYLGEDGVKQDFAGAKRLFALAAQLDSGEAYYWLANMYGRGDGVPTDYKMCRELSETALELGFEDAAKTIEILDQQGV